LALIDRSRVAIETAINSLDSLKVAPTVNSNAAIAAFSQEVDNLETESIWIRARAQVMQTRGDAYFDNWKENMAAISDKKIRASAEEHQSELRQSFATIKQNLQQTRQPFQLFLAGLRKLRTNLETKPATLAIESTGSLAQDTRQRGREVEAGLDSVAAELTKMTMMINPREATAKD
jgi:hypothetical protein